MLLMAISPFPICVVCCQHTFVGIRKCQPSFVAESTVLMIFCCHNPSLRGSKANFFEFPRHVFFSGEHPSGTSMGPKNMTIKKLLVFHLQTLPSKRNLAFSILKMVGRCSKYCISFAKNGDLARWWGLIDESPTNGLVMGSSWDPSFSMCQWNIISFKSLCPAVIKHDLLENGPFILSVDFPSQKPPFSYIYVYI